MATAHVEDEEVCAHREIIVVRARYVTYANRRYSLYRSEIKSVASIMILILISMKIGRT